ncbi:hypothetical protein CHK_2551 [Christensenella hongkongensis]|uniref:Uncharacterized protein n=1 Tax=Christensenella hongkongensis TaxID=270498 RepID=A0A0M2NI35_9FIRM|nr:hypothetical protein CHK_2551 [Christensenella hongkongensis]
MLLSSICDITVLYKVYIKQKAGKAEWIKTIPILWKNGVS